MNRRPSLREILSLWAAPAAYAGLLFWLSSGPIPDYVPQFSYSDKLIHFSAYFILGALVARGLLWSKWLKPLLESSRFEPWHWSGLAGAVYGLTDEIHQSFVPGRTASVSDAIADTLGAFAGAYVVWVLSRRLLAAKAAVEEDPTGGN